MNICGLSLLLTTSCLVLCHLASCWLRVWLSSGNNQLTGTLPSLETVVVLELSRNLLEGQGNLDRDLAARQQTGQKGPFWDSFCSSPVAVRCRELGRSGPKSAPMRPGKAPISPEKARFCRTDLPPIFSEKLGLNLECRKWEFKTWGFKHI